MSSAEWMKALQNDETLKSLVSLRQIVKWKADINSNLMESLAILFVQICGQRVRQGRVIRSPSENLRSSFSSHWELCWVIQMAQLR
jgi:hypothetical protein